MKHSREELPHAQSQGWQPRVQGAMAQGQLRGTTPRPRSGVVAKRSYPTSQARAEAGRTYPTPEARGRGQEEQPHLQEAVAAGAQEGLEELLHIQGYKGGR